MSGAEDQLSALRARRNAARADLLARVEAVRPLAKPKALAARVRKDAEYYARGAMTQAVEIAVDNRGVVVGTLAALLLWAGRAKVLEGVARLAPKAAPLWGKVKALWPHGDKREAE